MLRWTEPGSLGCSIQPSHVDAPFVRGEKESREVEERDVHTRPSMLPHNMKVSQDVP